MAAPTPTPFPPPRDDRMRTPEALRERDLTLAAAVDGDLPWLASLYASTRAEEMAAVPWPEGVKRLFLDEQFRLQHQDYLHRFPDSDFLVIRTRTQDPVGRYYLQRTAPDHLLVDIALFPRWRGLGIGTALIRQSQIDASASNRGLRLHVLQANPSARRLYERLGFVAGATDPPGYIAMRWPAPAR